MAAEFAYLAEALGFWKLGQMMKTGTSSDDVVDDAAVEDI